MSEIDTGAQLRPLSIEIEEFLEKEVPTANREPLDELLVGELLDAIQEGGEEGEKIQATIERCTSDMDRWKALLPQLGERVDTWQLRHAQRERYSEAWWNRKKRKLHDAFRDNQDQGLAYWLQTFAVALIDWDLDTCQKLANEPFRFAARSSFVTQLFGNGLESLREGDYRASLGMLTYLTQPGLKDSPGNNLPSIDRAILLVFMGRIHMEEDEDEEALSKFELARDVAPQDGQPQAALGQYYQSKEDYGRALSHHEKAIDFSPTEPDGSVGMGLVLEDQEWWEEAEDSYDQAVTCALQHNDPYVTLSKLLAPQSGKLFLQLAHALATKAPEAALQAITRALELGIKGARNYPDCAAYELQGSVLETLARDEEAAAAYYEAGRRYGWRSEHETAVTLLRTSLVLNEEHQRTYWQLSDNLRSSTNVIESEEKRKKVLKESLDIWDQGEKLGPITPDDSWTFLNRAFLFELQSGFSDVPPEQISGYLWQALIAVERALLLKEDESLRWAYLGHYYRMLKLEHNTLAVTKLALELDTYSTMAHEERLIILANRDQYDEALELADSWLDLDDTYEPWVRYIKAYIFSRQRDCVRALELSDDHKAEYYWVNDLRTHCYLMRAEDDGVLRESQAILDDHKAKGTTDWASIAWAALTVATMDKDDQALLIMEKAIEGLKGAQNNLAEAFDAGVALGVCYLAKKETFADGQHTLKDTVLLAMNVRELDNLENIDCLRARVLANKWEHHQEVEQFLERLVEDHIEPQRQKLQQEAESREKELDKRLETLTERGETDGAGWWSIHAGLARIYLEQGRWQKAAKTYLSLYTQTNIIPEAVRGLEKSTTELHQQAVNHIENADHAEAVPLLELSLELADLLDQTEKLPEMHGLCAYAEFMLSNSENARNHFVDSLHLYELQGNEVPGKAIGQLLLPLVPSVESYAALDTQLQAFAEDVEGEQIQADIADARYFLQGFLDSQYQLAEKIAFAPVVPRIALELNPALLPEGPSNQWPLIAEILPALRLRIHKEYGVQIPGVRIRAGGEYLGEDEYIILLDGAFLASGRARSGRNNISVEHLYSIIGRNLHYFLDVGAVEQLISQWQANEWAELLVNSTLPDQNSRLRFARVLRALVRERVPITQPEAILYTFQDQEKMLNDIELAEAVRLVRLNIKSRLPGNDGQYEKLLLPQEIESKIADYLHQENGKQFLALSVEEAGRLKQTIGELASATPQNTVLVCQDDKLRPLIRQFIESDFPDLLVLSQAETELNLDVLSR